MPSLVQAVFPCGPDRWMSITRNLTERDKRIEICACQDAVRKLRLLRCEIEVVQPAYLNQGHAGVCPVTPPLLRTQVATDVADSDAQVLRSNVCWILVIDQNRNRNTVRCFFENVSTYKICDTGTRNRPYKNWPQRLRWFAECVYLRVFLRGLTTLFQLIIFRIFV